MPMPAFKPTTEQRAQVQALSSFGVPQDVIAEFLSIDPKTLRKYFPDELKKASLQANAQVAKFLFTAASGQALGRGASYADCIRAAMFWAKTRMGWNEVHKHELSGPGGGPVESVTSEMTPAQAAEAYARTLHDPAGDGAGAGDSA